MEITWVTYTCRHRPDNISGLVITFHDTNPECEGSILFCKECEPLGEIWELIKKEPLTVTPSIQCRTHSHHHGHITNGKWIPA